MSALARWATDVAPRMDFLLPAVVSTMAGGAAITYLPAHSAAASVLGARTLSMNMTRKGSPCCTHCSVAAGVPVSTAAASGLVYYCGSPLDRLLFPFAAAGLLGVCCGAGGRA